MPNRRLVSAQKLVIAMAFSCAHVVEVIACRLKISNEWLHMLEAQDRWEREGYMSMHY